MKKLILGVAMTAAAVIGAWPMSGADETKPDATVASAAAKPEQSPLHLSADRRAAAGITLAAPQQVVLPPEIEAFGRVLDPTPYATLVAEEATARAAATASEKELQRVQKLFSAGGNASAQAVEAAEAAAARDRAAVESAHVRLLASWGKNLTDHADLAALNEMLARGAALIRIDLLPGVTPPNDLKSATVAMLGAQSTYTVEVLGPAPVADPQVQGASFLALLRDHSLPAGATLHVVLRAAGEGTPGLSVPRAAIVYYEGSAWVYGAGANDTFHRQRVELGRSLGDAVVVTSGVAADEQVVVTGAQQLLSSELQAGAEGSDQR